MLKSVRSIDGFLQMTPAIMFDFLRLITSIKVDSSSFFLYIFKVLQHTYDKRLAM